MPGKICLVLGPMFAGKTTELQRRVKRELYAQRTCCVIKYSKDNRYSADAVSTHDKSMVRADFAANALLCLKARVEKFDVIAVDEGQFFPDLLEFSELMADSGKTIIISALDGDFQRRPFGKVCELIPLCDEVVKLNAVCMTCHKADAPFTARTVSNSEQELIGGAESYAAACRKCFLANVPPTPGKVSRYRAVCKEVAIMEMKEVPSFDVEDKENQVPPASTGSSPDGAAVSRETAAATPTPNRKRARDDQLL